MPRSQATALLVLTGGLFLGACPESLIAAQSKSPSKRLPTPLLPAEEAWLVQLPAPLAAGGVMDAERVYVPLLGNAEEPSGPGLVALDRESGSTIWTREVRSSWSPVIANGLLFVSTESEVQALDPLTGELKWQANIMGKPTAPLVFGEAWILVVTEPAVMTAIRSSDGEVAWTRPLAAPSRLPPALGQRGMAYLSLADGRVIALSLGTGQTKWERKLPGTLTAPAVARDRVLVGSTDNFFYALDDDTGDIDWKWRTGGDVVGSTADDGSVYFAALDNVVRRVNRGNGHQRWKRGITTRPIAPPLALSGNVVVAGIAPALSTFDDSTGVATGTYDAPGNPPGDLQGPPLLDAALRPFRVAIIVLLRDGRAVGLRPIALMFREAPPEPLLALPGRALTRERLP